MHIQKSFCVFSAAAALLLGGCSTAPRAPEPSAASTVPSRLSPEQATDITIYALSLVGTPYRYGGNTPDAGFDCSGLIGYVYQNRAGLKLPRTVAQLQSAGQAVPREELRSGDLVVFGRGTHAGIYVGEGRFVHAPSSGGEVRLNPLDSGYWATQKMAFRRP
ncbi:cell wall-associated NlpC family hydrolase [Rhodoferax ferrireducens]|uniref:Cell wall-associated NlpC family hydrolase n=1 Tax=Rhodoferax ferrireducens TaxID=192843 RepID=A0ABU2CBU2_9BURK|nr:C40 family peptidase [Rhodoferax ferrireducens]MDR7378808.1 cell wall-associated NlpC family hydrolase [Rhodoferax ferrireducens]